MDLMVAKPPDNRVPTMRLIETLRTSIEQDDSPFRIQLMREDIDRLNTLSESARQLSDSAALERVALELAWTADPVRTADLQEQITRLSDAVYALESKDGMEVESGPRRDAMQSAVEIAWLRLHHIRLERMVGCLATPLPKSVD